MKHLSKLSLMAIACLLLAARGVFAGSPVPTIETEPQGLNSRLPSLQGIYELEFGLGAFGAIATDGSAQRPAMGFGLTQINFGTLLSDVHGSGLFRGNGEWLIGRFSEPGNVIIGAKILYR